MNDPARTTWQSAAIEVARDAIRIRVADARLDRNKIFEAAKVARGLGGTAWCTVRLPEGWPKPVDVYLTYYNKGFSPECCDRVTHDYVDAVADKLFLVEVEAAKAIGYNAQRIFEDIHQNERAQAKAPPVVGTIPQDDTSA